MKKSIEAQFQKQSSNSHRRSSGISFLKSLIFLDISTPELLNMNSAFFDPATLEFIKRDCSNPFAPSPCLRTPLPSLPPILNLFDKLPSLNPPSANLSRNVSTNLNYEIGKSLDKKLILPQPSFASPALSLERSSNLLTPIHNASNQDTLNNTNNLTAFTPFLANENNNNEVNLGIKNDSNFTQQLKAFSDFVKQKSTENKKNNSP
jgi:hypothetical protein